MVFINYNNYWSRIVMKKVQRSFHKLDYIVLCVIIFIAFIHTSLKGQDWPIYKGNIYFTGNNDEVIVKNNNNKSFIQ